MTSLLNRNKPTGQRDVQCSLGGGGRVEFDRSRKMSIREMEAVMGT